MKPLEALQHALAKAPNTAAQWDALGTACAAAARMAHALCDEDGTEEELADAETAFADLVREIASRID